MALTNGFEMVATEASLQDILAKLIANPATAAGQEAQRLLLSQIAASLTAEGGYLDGVEGLLAAIGNALATTLKVSATALPLPTGAATAAAQETMRALLAGTLAVSAQALPLPAGAATSGKQDAASTLLTTIASALAGTLAVSAAALPLPSGAATGAKQDTGNTALTQIVTALSATLSVLPVIKPWAAWTPATANDMRNYAGVEIQVTGAGTATFTRSADDTTYAAISATTSGVSASNPLALGFYSLKGGGFLKFAGTATILIRGYN